MIDYDLSKIKLSNNKNPALYDHLQGLGLFLQEFDHKKINNNVQQKSTARIEMNRSGSGIDFSITDLPTGDIIAGYAKCLIR